MPKEARQFVCSSCAYASPKWLGRCPSCQNWNTFTEEVRTRRSASDREDSAQAPVAISRITRNFEDLLPTGIKEFDRVLGGGFTPNSTILLSGDPGIGKSTLVLDIMERLARSGSIALYVTGEESSQQVRLRAERLGACSDNLLVLAQTDLSRVLEAIKETRPSVVAIDSVQTLYSDEIDSAPGTVSQIRESAQRLIEIAKTRDICIFFIGHVTKEGQIAGPMTLEHMVDTVIYFEGDPRTQYRLLRAVKNRFGATNEVGVFEMREDGLKEVANPSGIFLSETCEKAPGSTAVASIEGTRPFLVEVQALVSQSGYSVPTRISTGMDRNRVMLLIAILEKRLGLDLRGMDIFVNITGGFRITERASDLGVACAITSSFRNSVMPKKTFVFGELGLSGEIRGSGFAEKRVLEGAKLGFSRCIMPLENLKKIALKDTKIELLGIKSLDEIMHIAF